MIINLSMSGRAFQYLANQRGEFYHLKGNSAEWLQAYHDELQMTMNQLSCYQQRPMTVLDLGSGLGAIDVLLIKKYGSHCVLVDGEDGDGEAHKYDKPFGNREVVREFMNDNGVSDRQWTYCNPEQLLDEREFPVFDLVLSLRSWCFHYPPSVYMSFVQRHIAPTSRLLLDVRKNRTWRTQLEATWKDYFVFEEYEKYERVGFNVGGRVQ